MNLGFWGGTARLAVLIGREPRTAVGFDPTANVDRAPQGLLSAQEGITRRTNARPRPRLWPGTRVRRAPEKASGRFRLLGRMRARRLGCASARVGCTRRRSARTWAAGPFRWFWAAPAGVERAEPSSVFWPLG